MCRRATYAFCWPLKLYIVCVSYPCLQCTLLTKNVHLKTHFKSWLYIIRQKLDKSVTNAFSSLDRRPTDLRILPYRVCSRSSETVRWKRWTIGKPKYAKVKKSGRQCCWWFQHLEKVLQQCFLMLKYIEYFTGSVGNCCNPVNAI